MQSRPIAYAHEDGRSLGIGGHVNLVFPGVDIAGVKATIIALHTVIGRRQ